MFSVKISKSVASELKSALVELFKEMKLSCIKVEGQLELNCSNFIDDVTKMLDEIRDPDDIIKFWHVERDLARNVYLVVSPALMNQRTAQQMMKIFLVPRRTFPLMRM